MKTASVLIALIFSSITMAEQPIDKPNILFLLSDDQSWSGLSVAMHPNHPESKSKVIATPNIAQLAAQGMLFSRAYAPAPVCSPTRISLQTGKSPAQLHWTKAAPVMTARDGLKLFPPAINKNIAQSEITIAELLRQRGYATAHYGKWHIGGAGPQNHGYDESDGDTGNNDAIPHTPPNPVDIFGMGERAMDFMDRNVSKGKPFFIQMSYHALHHPENADPKLVKKYEVLMKKTSAKQSGRAALAEDLDRGVGILLAKLEALGISNNTYVVYMSDNGSGGNKLLKGGKGSLWEGGIRVPLIIRGPGIKAGQISDESIVGYDLFPTFYHLAGGNKPLPNGVEGGDISSLLTGESGPVKRPSEDLVFHFPHYQGTTPHSVIYQDNFKLIYFYETDSSKLFDLDKDISESQDLSLNNSKLSANLLTRLKSQLASINAQLPKMNPDYDGVTQYDPKGRQKGKGDKGKSKNKGKDKNKNKRKNKDNNGGKNR